MQDATKTEAEEKDVTEPDAAAVATAMSSEAAQSGAEGGTAGASASAGVIANGITAAHTNLPPEEVERLSNDLVAALKTVFDPEIPVDIYELGLIYRVEIDENRNVEADMTLTAPGCPVAGEMPAWVEDAISSVPGVGQVKVNLVFDPPWDMSRMSEEARIALNMF